MKQRSKKKKLKPENRPASLEEERPAIVEEERPAIVETIYEFPKSTNYWDVLEWISDVVASGDEDYPYPFILKIGDAGLRVRDDDELLLLDGVWQIARPMVVASNPTGDRVIDALCLRLAKAEEERDRLREELDWKLKGFDDLDQEEADSLLTLVRDSLVEVKTASFAEPNKSEQKRAALAGPPKRRMVRR